MPTTSMPSSLRLKVALVAVAILVAPAASRAESASFRLPELGAIAIAAEGGHVRARRVPRPPALPSSRGESVAVDRRLTSELRRAAQLMAVAGRGFTEHGRTFLLLGVAIPSVAKQGLGFCGAGTEDYLLLVEWMAGTRKLELRDRVQVQSCLKPMVLQSDQGTDLRVVLGGIDDPANFRLTWLEHPAYGPGTKTLAVDNGKFVVLR